MTFFFADDNLFLFSNHNIFLFFKYINNIIDDYVIGNNYIGKFYEL